MAQIGSVLVVVVAAYVRPEMRSPMLTTTVKIAGAVCLQS